MEALDQIIDLKQIIGLQKWYFLLSLPVGASQVALVEKNLPANAGDTENGFDPWVRKILRKRAWQPTPVFLPGESHGQRSLAGYRP